MCKPRGPAGRVEGFLEEAQSTTSPALGRHAAATLRAGVCLQLTYTERKEGAPRLLSQSSKSSKSRCSMAQQGPLHRLSQDQNQRLGRAAFLSADSGDEHASKLLQAKFSSLQL